jgi:hypothetical protein
MQSAVHNQVDLLGLLPPEPSPEAVSQLFGAVNESATLSMAIKACRTAAARLNAWPVLVLRGGKFNGPAPPSWVGSLHDGVVDALVFVCHEARTPVSPSGFCVGYPTHGIASGCR